MITDIVQYTDFHNDDKFRLKNLTNYQKTKDTNQINPVKTEREVDSIVEEYVKMWSH
jgi:hypothetical protein